MMMSCQIGTCRNKIDDVYTYVYLDGLSFIMKCCACIFYLHNYFDFG